MTITASHVQARRLLASARGVSEDGPTDCAVCGPESPFGPGRPAAKVFGPNFSDLASCVAPHLPDVCAGCVSLLAGRPGDDPPPLRIMHCLAVPGRSAVYPGRKELAQYLRTPPEGPHVLVWATSGKRHASLRAQMSTPRVQLVGADEGTIRVERRHLAVLDAIEEMRAYTRADVILAGGADPFAAQRAGAARWERWRALVAPYRDTLLLDLLVTVATKRPPTEAEEENVLSKSDRDAVTLLSALAVASAVRRADGLNFWRSLLERRVAARSRHELPTLVSRLMADLRVDALHPSLVELVQELQSWSRDRQEACREALLRRPSLLVATVYAEHKAAKEAAPTLFSNEEIPT